MKKVLMVLVLVSLFTGLFGQNLTLTSPDGYENWSVGSQHYITWTDNGLWFVNLYYSTNGGADWIVIYTWLTNNHSYYWQIPNTPSTTCKVKVADAYSPSVFDVSNANFTISPVTATLTVEPKYSGTAAWDYKTWELFVDGIGQGSTTGNKTVSVTTGSHSIKGKILLGQYVAETKVYNITVPSGGYTTQVWWDKVLISVTYNGIQQTSGYTLTVNNQSQSSPLDHTLLGDGVTNIPITCTWTATSQSQTLYKSYATYGGQTASFSFVSPTANLTVEPKYSGTAAWDYKTWELFVDGIGQGSTTGNKTVSVTTGSHSIKGKILLGQYVAETKVYNITVPSGGYTTQVWWDKVLISVTYNGIQQTSGYTLTVNNQSQSSPLDHTLLGDGVTNIPITCTWTATSQSQTLYKSYATYGGQTASFSFVSPTANLTVEPKYSGTAAWDYKTWELFVDGIGQGSTTGNKTVSVTTGSHSIKGKILLGQYVAETKVYNITVPSGGYTTQVWWDKVLISVTYNGIQQTSGYTLTVNNQSQSSPLDHTLLGDGVTNIPITCTWTATSQSQTLYKSYATYGGQTASFSFVSPTANLTVEPKYSGTAAWDYKTWELFVDGIGQGSTTGNKTVSVTTGSHSIKGKILLGQYVAETKVYNITVPSGGYTTQVWWDKVLISVTYNGIQQTSGYTLTVNNQSQSSPLDHTLLGDGVTNIPITCTWTATSQSQTLYKSYATYGGQTASFSFVSPTANLTVEPKYSGTAAWDYKTWELFVDGIGQGSTTGNKTVSVTTGSHSIKGKILLGQYVAETKVYNITVPSGGYTTQVWWDKVLISVTYNGIQQTSGYTLTVNNQSQSSPLDHTLLGDGVTNIPITCTWTATSQSQTLYKSYATYGGQTASFSFVSPTANLTVEPKYSGTAAWDYKTWELFVDGIGQGSTTGNKTVSVTTGSHSIKGKILLGQYVAETKVYNITVPSGGYTTQVWWDKVLISVTYNGIQQTSGYTLTVNNQSQSSPLDHTLLGDGVTNIPITCTWTATSQSQTLYKSYATYGGQTASFSFVSPTANLTVEPKYSGTAAWDYKTWELFVDGIGQGSTTGNKTVSVTTGSHSIKGKILLGQYVAETKVYNITVPSGGYTTQVWWDKVLISVTYNGIQQTSGYTLTVNNQSQSSPLDHTLLGDGVTNIPITCTWTATSQSQTLYKSYATYGGQTASFSFVSPTANLTVEPKYSGTAAWDYKTWELFVDGIGQGSTTGNKTVSVTTGSHSIKGKILLGQYVAETKVYNITVPSGGYTTQVWWDKVLISVTYNGIQQTSGYTLTVNNQSQSSPLDHTLLGDGVTNIPITCTWTATSQSQTLYKSYATYGGQTASFSFGQSNSDFIKVIGVIQNTHKAPNNPPGLKIVTKIVSNYPISQVELEWDNLDDLIPQGIFAGVFTAIGNNYYLITVDHALIGDFNSGDRIKWKIKAKDSQNSWSFYPSWNSFDTTKIYSYAALNSSLHTVNGIHGIVKAVVDDYESITIKNNKAIFIHTKLLNGNFPIENGDFLVDALSVLSAKSIPFSFETPPEMTITGLNNLTSNSELQVACSKWGDNNRAFLLTLVDFISNASSCLSDIDEVKKAQTYKALYDIISDILYPVITDPSFSSLDYMEKMSLCISTIADEFTSVPTAEYWIQRFYNALVPIIGPVIATKVPVKIISFFVPIAQLFEINSYLNAALTLVDFITTSDQPDIVTVSKSSGHFIELTPLTLPGVTGSNPVARGSSTNFAFRIKNISNQKLYNVWLGLDIYGWDYCLNQYTKIENTKTSFIDPETGKIGMIDFGITQGIDLRSGETRIFISDSYNFTNSITGNPYNAGNRPYKYVFTVWSNGEPGQIYPSTAIDLAKDILPMPFYIKDSQPPSPPQLTNYTQLETDTTATICISLNNSEFDVDAVKVYSNSLFLLTLDPKICLSALIQKTESIQEITAISVDVGGLQSGLSNVLEISAKALYPGVSLSYPVNNTSGIPLTTDMKCLESNKTPAGYSFEVSKDSSFSSIVYTTESSVNNIIIPQGTLEQSSKYYYRARVQYMTGQSTWSHAWKFKTVDNSLPAPILQLPINGASLNSNQVELTWLQVTEASGYVVQISLIPSFYQPIMSAHVFANVYSYLLGAVPPNSTFYWRVCAKDQIGGTGPWSEIRMFQHVNVGVDENSDTKSILFKVFPNPCSDVLILSYDINVPSQVDVHVFNILGKETVNPIQGEKQPGIYSEIINTSSWPTGLHFIRIQIGDKCQLRKVIKQ